MPTSKVLPKVQGTPRPVRATDEEFDGIMVNIRNKRSKLKAAGVRPNWSSVGLALFRAFKAGKILVEQLKGFGDKKAKP